ncbi:MAG: helix-turn-helix transcriptional regulator [Clostridia bacterium]|jgi:transcriptional regulator with XRE-family HTH domain|nr:helix-turn-helix transcriptional regulator [Clostridia bacterium]
MNEIYARIEALCKSRGMNITEMCKKCSIPRASLTDFKMGRNKSLSASTLQKIAEYFSVSVEYLLVGEAPSSEEVNLKIALFGGEEGITDEMLEEVKKFAAYIKERENGNKQAL